MKKEATVVTKLQFQEHNIEKGKLKLTACHKESRYMVRLVAIKYETSEGCTYFGFTMKTAHGAV